MEIICLFVLLIGKKVFIMAKNFSQAAALQDIIDDYIESHLEGIVIQYSEEIKRILQERENYRRDKIREDAEE